MHSLSQNKILHIHLLVVLFLSLFFIRFNSVDKKKELHADEIFSFMLAKNIGYYWSAIDDGVYSGLDLKSKIFENNIDDRLEENLNNCADDFKSDMAHLWINNGDTPHASLYYMMLRISFFIADIFKVSPVDTDVGYVINVGFWLNILFFTISFLFMYLTLKMLLKDNFILILIGLTICYSTPMSIENSLLIREYQMAEMFIVMLTFVSVLYIKRLINNDKISYISYMFMFGLSVAGALSTGYLNAIYILLVGVALIIFSVKHNRSKLSILIILSAIFGLLLAWSLYAGFFNFLLYKSVHTSRAFESPMRVLNYVFVRDLTNGCFKIYGLLVLFFTVVMIVIAKQWRRLFSVECFLWLPIIAVVSMYLVQYTAVLKMSRYSYPLLPVVSLIFPLTLSVLHGMTTRFLGVAISLFYLILSVVNPIVKSYGWGYIRQQMKEDATIYKLNSTEIVQVIPCLNDTAKYRVVNSVSGLQIGEKNGENSGMTFPSRVVVKSSCNDIPQEVIKDRRRLVGKSISIITTNSHISKDAATNDSIK